jgi:heme exporter protein D
VSWASWSDFLSMGGYGLYVWGSYGVTAVLLTIEVVLLLKRRRNILEYATLTARERRPGGRDHETTT